MRVAFSTTVLAKGMAHSAVDGIGSYTRELGGLLARRIDVSLVPVGFGLAVEDGVLDGAESPVTFDRYAQTALLSAVTSFPFPSRALIERNVDVFHATDHLIPKLTNVPVVATLMDAIPLSHPEWVRMNLAAMKRWLWRKAATWADHVVTISEYSKAEIVQHFGIPESRISVTPLGVDQRFFERIDTQIKNEILHRLNLPDAFFLFVGTLQPRKNLQRVLDAHAGLPDYLRKSVPLVVVGRAGWGCDELVARLSAPGSTEHVRWLQYLPDLEVRALMQSAKALVFPSLCEGFGLPVLEAFASGLPVVTANTTSLPEVAGDAALMVNPTDVGEISDAMTQVIDSSGLAKRLSDAGLARARKFDWETCATTTMAAYRQACAG